jgi:hypothetical protein
MYARSIGAFIMASNEKGSQDKRMWFWRPLVHRHESEETKQTRSEIFDVLPRETVTDEYGTRPKWHGHIESILKNMPPDSKRLHPDEPRWQTVLAPKYLKNPKARETFLDRMRSTDAGKAYLYFPLGSEQPNVWYEHEGRHPAEDARYSIEEFERKYGGEESIE